MYKWIKIEMLPGSFDKTQLYIIEPQPKVIVASKEWGMYQVAIFDVSTYEETGSLRESLWRYNFELDRYEDWKGELSTHCMRSPSTETIPL